MNFSGTAPSERGFDMDFAGMNYVAVLIAAVAAFMLGGLYYGALVAKPWMKAARLTQAQTAMTASLFVTTFVCELIMAIGIAGVLGHLGTGQVTLWNGVVTGFFLAITLIIPAMTMNQRYQGFGWDLALIDGVHWIAVAVLIGGIVGWMGV
jgi:uncharacterized membrane protein required for colicin V production